MEGKRKERLEEERLRPEERGKEGCLSSSTDFVFKERKYKEGPFLDKTKPKTKNYITQMASFILSILIMDILSKQ